MVEVGENGPYKMRTIARITDFSPALLRAWERRHQILKPLRGPGGHRLYTDEDLQILLRVKELIREGRSIGEIAAGGRESLLNERPQEAQPGKPPPIPETGPELERELDAWVGRIVEAALKIDTGEITFLVKSARSRSICVGFAVIEAAAPLPCQRIAVPGNSPGTPMPATTVGTPIGYRSARC